MPTRRRILLVAAGCVVLCAAAILAWMRAANRPRLPRPEHYANLPHQFDAALQRAREKAGPWGDNPEAVRELAQLYQANRLFAEARACYRVVAASPQGLGARDHYRLALIALDESDSDGAQAELRATLAAEPRYLPARIALADTLFRSGRPDDAQREYETALQAKPDQPQALLGLARIALQKGDDDRAIARLRELVRRHPEFSTGSALLAQVLDRKGEADEAVAMTALSKRSHDPVPPDPWAQDLLVDCYDLARLGIAFEQYRLSGQMDEALPLLSRLEELDPTGWTAPMLRGWSQRQAGRYPEAVREYRKALANGGDPERICPLLVNALLSEKDDKSAAEAAALLADYHAKLPLSTPILLSYCEVAVRQRNDALARRLLTQVLKAEPDLYMPNMSLVQILWNAGEKDAAAPYLRRVARVFPEDVDSRGLLAQYYMEKADPFSAIVPLEQALARAPAADARRQRLTRMLDSAYLTAGSLEASRGRFGSAVLYAEKSIRLVPDGLRGYALKLNACMRLGDLKGEAQALERMTALQPGEAGLQLTLGDVLLQLGNNDQARAHWQRALELAPPGASELRDDLALRLSGSAPAGPSR